MSSEALSNGKASTPGPVISSSSGVLYPEIHPWWSRASAKLLSYWYLMLEKLPIDALSIPFNYMYACCVKWKGACNILLRHDLFMFLSLETSMFLINVHVCAYAHSCQTCRPNKSVQSCIQRNAGLVSVLNMLFCVYFVSILCRLERTIYMSRMVHSPELIQDSKWRVFKPRLVDDWGGDMQSNMLQD